MDYVIGVDIGGTFTDCVILDSNGKLTIGKALSTPHDFSLGVVDSLEDGAANLGLPSVDALLRSTHLFFHACTVADNTLITRTGARTGLVVTQGFPDTFLDDAGQCDPWPDGGRRLAHRGSGEARAVGAAKPDRAGTGTYRLQGVGADRRR